jgi:hypothetical protein
MDFLANNSNDRKKMDSPDDVETAIEASACYIHGTWRFEPIQNSVSS